MPRGRLVLGLFVLPAVMYGGAVIVAWSLQDRLPEPVATHWNASGQTNGTMTLGQLLLFVTAMTLLLWGIGAAAVFAGHAARVRFRAERAAMAWACGVTAFDASLLLLTVRANLDQPSWADAHLGAIAIVPTLFLAVVAGCAGWILAGPPPVHAVPEVPPASGPDEFEIPPLELASDAHLVWHHDAHSQMMGVLAAALLMGGFVMLWYLPFGGVLLLVSGIAMVAFVKISVVVDETGLSIRFGPLGWPRRHVALAKIARVSVDYIEPLEWGGWGYRIVPGRSAVVLRRGPGLVVELRDGRKFAVTVDDPRSGAALLEAYRLRSHAD